MQSATIFVVLFALVACGGGQAKVVWNGLPDDQVAIGAGRADISIRNSYGPHISVNVADRGHREQCPSINGGNNQGLVLQVSINGQGCPTAIGPALEQEQPTGNNTRLGWPLMPNIGLTTTWGVIVDVQTSGNARGWLDSLNNSTRRWDCQSVIIENSDGVHIDLALTNSRQQPDFHGINVSNRKGVSISMQANIIGCSVPYIYLTNVHGAIINLRANL